MMVIGDEILDDLKAAKSMRTTSKKDIELITRRCINHGSKPDTDYYCDECGLVLLHFHPRDVDICPKCKRGENKDKAFCWNCGWDQKEPYYNCWQRLKKSIRKFYDNIRKNLGY